MLHELLRAQQSLIQFQFKSCLTSLYVSRVCLYQWEESNGDVPLPKVFHWLERLHKALLSKATLFFHRPLSRREASIGGSIQTWASKCHNYTAT